MKVTLKAIKRLIETGAAVDVTKCENYKRDPMSTILYYSVGDSGVNGAALVLWDGTIHAVVGRTNALFAMIH